MVRFRLLGSIDLRDENGTELRTVLAQPKRLALLAYLCLIEGCRRDRLLALFWPDASQERARNALNKTVHFLRQMLGDAAIVSRGADELAVDRGQLWCDVPAFLEALTSRQLQEALELYDGELLPSFHTDSSAAFEEWLDQQRDRLRRLAADAARQACDQRAGEGDLAAAVTLARRAVDLSGDDERAVRRLLQLLDAVGDRAGALHEYERFAHHLAVEYGSEPSAETRQLVTRIRERSAAHDSSGFSEPTEVHRSSQTLTTVEEPRAHTPGGAHPGEMPVSIQRRRWVRRFVAACIILLTGTGALLVTTRDTPSGILRDNLLVVAPVNVLAADLDLWREGLVEVLSRSLDGAGDLRAVAPAIVIKAASAPNAVTPEDLARHTRARLVLIGTLQRTGLDSARFSVVVRDVERQVTRGEIDRRDAIGRMDHLADSVAMEVLRVLFGETTRRSPPLRTVGTKSFAALKEFLQGQLTYRRRIWDSSASHFLRAIALDSAFALAYVGVASSFAQLPVARAVPDASVFSFRAAAFNHGLGARDSSLILLDSVYFAAYRTPTELPHHPEYWSHLRRSMATAERLVADYPEDAEVWARYAEVLYHMGGVATRTPEEQVLEAFNRALALDPELGAAYSHSGDLGLLLRGREGQKRPGIIAARHGIGTAARDTRIVSELEHSASANPSRARRLIDTLSIDVLWANYHEVIATDVDATLFPAATTRLRTAIRNSTLPGVSERELDDVNVSALLKFGRFKEAARAVDAVSQPLLFASAGLLGALPDHRTQPVFAVWLNQASPPFECLRLLDWWAQRGDAASIERCAVRRMREFRADSLIAVRQMATPAARLGEAFAALARRDTSRAVRLFDAFPDSLCPVWCWFAVGPRVRLLAAVGRQREALELANYRSHVDFAFPALTVPTALVRARLASQLGDPGAVAAYRVVAETWAYADSSLQPVVSEAAAAIHRLDTTRRP